MCVCVCMYVHVCVCVCVYVYASCTCLDTDRFLFGSFSLGTSGHTAATLPTAAADTPLPIQGKGRLNLDHFTVCSRENGSALVVARCIFASGFDWVSRKRDSKNVFRVFCVCLGRVCRDTPLSFFVRLATPWA